MHATTPAASAFPGIVLRAIVIAEGYPNRLDVEHRLAARLEQYDLRRALGREPHLARGGGHLDASLRLGRARIWPGGCEKLTAAVPDDLLRA